MTMSQCIEDERVAEQAADRRTVKRRLAKKFPALGGLTRTEYHRRRHLLVTYKLSRADYWQIYAAQDGKCGICGNAETRIIKGTLAELAVDHNHKTDEIRGLLCSQCNRALGLLNDDPVILEACLAWLA